MAEAAVAHPATPVTSLSPNGRYDVLETMGVDGNLGVATAADAKAIHDFYKVLNQICAAGVLMEIMLLPPAIRRDASVLENIDLWIVSGMGLSDIRPRIRDKGAVGGRAPSRRA